jgi:hypothetical protein
MMKSEHSLIAHLSSFKGNDEVLLIVCDDQTIGWLIARFEEFVSAPGDVKFPSFVIGDGNPVESDGRCLLDVHLDDRERGSQLTEAPEGIFRWNVSRSSAERFRSLLSGMVEHHEPLRDIRSSFALEGSDHQYLDPDNCPPAPAIIVSRGEYNPDAFRRPNN